MNAKASRWLGLVMSLPTRNSTARMRLWRALKSLGCGVLRDGVYLLPHNPEAERLFCALEKEIADAGGAAQALHVFSRNGVQHARFSALFDRGSDYASLIGEIAKSKKPLPKANAAALQKLAKRLRREFEAISAIDFFPGPARAQAEAALAELEAGIQAIIAPDEPHAAAGAIRRLDCGKFKGRLWATRQHLWVDRLASAWLIRRFIDPEARFTWLKNPKDCPRKALGFDFDGATFTHVGARVTFEVLLASFGMETDAALARIGALVHYLDVGGIPVPEAAGLEAVLRGARQRCQDDDALLAEAAQLFESIYTAYSEEKSG